MPCDSVRSESHDLCHSLASVSLLSLTGIRCCPYWQVTSYSCRLLGYPMIEPEDGVEQRPADRTG